MMESVYGVQHYYTGGMLPRYKLMDIHLALRRIDCANGHGSKCFGDNDQVSWNPRPKKH